MILRCYRALLHSYPPVFRRRFADELEAAFLAGLAAARAGGGIRTIAFLFSSGADAVVNGVRERRSQRRRSASPKGDPGMLTLLSDLRFALRLMVRSPRVALLAVGTLGLGIALSVSLYSVAHGALVRPLPFRDESRVVMMYEHAPQNGTVRGNVAPANFLDWRERSRAFSHMGALRPFSATVISASGEAVRANGRRILGDAFGALGLDATVGRLLRPDDETSDARIVVLSHRLWLQHFGGDPAIVGRSITVDEQPHTVVGVLEPVLRIPGGPAGYDALFVPWVLPPALKGARMSHISEAVARVAPAVTLDQAQADVARVAASLALEYPQSNKDETVLLVPVREALVGDLRPALLVLAAAVSVVLLIACVNVGSLLLARAAARRQEMAVRAAIGAGRARLVRQLLAESLLLGTVAGVVGLWLAYWCLAALRLLLPQELATAVEARVDPAAASLALGASLLTAVVFGLAPARFLPGSGTAAAVREVRGSIGGAGARSALVVVQVALAVVLLTGAGLLARSFGRLTSVDPGFQAGRLLTFEVELPRPRYAGPPQWQPFFDRLIGDLQAIPGVLGAAASSGLPLNENGGSVGFLAEGQPRPADNQATFVIYRLVTNGYFSTLGIPLFEGRDFSPADRPADAPAVVIVNRALASRYWPAQSAVGKRVAFTTDPKPTDWATVVGVVGDTHHSSLAEAIDIQLYVPYQQEPNWYPPGQIVLRTEGEPTAVARAVRERLRAIDPMIPVSEIRTMESVIGRSVAAPRFNVALLGVLSVSSLVLAVVGIYGLLSFSVALRTREIGVRSALGATRGAIAAMIMREGIRLAAAGVVLGLAAAAICAQWLETLLFEVAPHDPVTYAGIAAAILLAALAACYAPARRASRVDPLVALRAD